jgi:hypothetical protein
VSLSPSADPKEKRLSSALRIRSKLCGIAVIALVASVVLALYIIVPGAKLYLFADKIVNLNLSYESAESLPDALAKFLRERCKPPPD